MIAGTDKVGNGHVPKSESSIGLPRAMGVSAQTGLWLRVPEEEKKSRKKLTYYSEIWS